MTALRLARPCRHPAFGRAAWLLLLSALPVAAPAYTARADNLCRGKPEACAALTLSADGCKLSNTSDKEMQVLVNKPGGGFSSYSILPGQTESAHKYDGCLEPGKTVTTYQVVLVLPSLFGAPTGPRCTGDSCKKVALTKKDACFTIQSHATTPLIVEVTTGGRTLTFGLEPGELEPSSGDDRFSGTYGKKYEPFNNSYYGTFSAKLDGPGGCIADKSKIESYSVNVLEEGVTVAGTVNLLSKPSQKAGPTEAAALARPKGKAKHAASRPCRGTACDVLFAEPARIEKCRILNGGTQPIVVRVVQRRGGRLTTAPIAPGAEASLGTPMGCIATDNIVMFEANYAR